MAATGHDSAATVVRASAWTRAGRRFWPALRKLHAWAGLAACAFLLAIAFSGTILVFEEPYLRATVPGAAHPPVTSPDQLGAALAAAERTFGADSMRSMVFASERLGLHAISFRDGGGAWLDPATFAVIERWERHGRVGEWLLALHHELLADDAGETVVGTVALVAFVLVLSGVAYWAKLKFKGARAWPRSTSARELDVAHRTWGLVAAVPLALLLLTGAGMALPSVSRPLLGAITGEPFAEPVPPRLATRAGVRGPVTIDWVAGLRTAQAAFPTAVPRIAVWPRGGVAPYMRMRQPEEWHSNGRSTVWFDPASGAMLKVRDAVRAPAAARVFDTFWPLHASRIGGVAWQLATMLVGLTLAALAVTGALAYVKRLKR
jgi:uncharacterized iron-regulated membrane protein